MTSTKNRESGLLTLEACISLTFFIFLMLFMYSVFVIFEARNEIGHTLLTTANSMSLDAYAGKNLGDSSLSGDAKESIQSFLYEFFSSKAESDGKFTETEDWYNNKDMVISVAKKRFKAYLSGGNEEEADRILRSLRVVDGIDGLDFSKSKVEGGDLYLVVNYKLEYEYKVFNLGILSFQQACCSKLWNK